MKQRNASARNQTENRNLFSDTFLIATEFLNDVVVKLFGNNIIGRPYLNVAFNANKITGILLTFDGKKSIQGFRYSKLSGSHFSSEPASRIGNHTIISPNNEKHPRSIEYRDLNFHQNDSFYVKVFVQEENDLNSKQTIVRLLKKRIVDRIKSQYGISFMLDLPLRVTITELYSAAIEEIEIYNDVVGDHLNSREATHSITRHFPNAKEESLTKTLYSSNVLEKEIWWINLKSQEVSADGRGILFRGKIYVPVDESDFIALQNMVLSEDRKTVTIYKHPYYPTRFYWVHKMRFIALKFRVVKSIQFLREGKTIASRDFNPFEQEISFH